MLNTRPLVGLLALSLFGQIFAQSDLVNHPRYKKMRAQQDRLMELVPGGDVRGFWDGTGQSFFYEQDGKKYRFDTLSQKSIPEDFAAPARNGRRNRGGPARGRQFDTAYSADGKLMAKVKDRNVYLGPADKEGVAITNDGSEQARIKNGVASWVYGEELDQREAMWFSPDGRYLAYYRFDESKVRDYYLALNQNDVQSTLDHEAYPKAGANNPVVDVVVYDLQTKKRLTVDVRFDSGGKTDLGHYVYAIEWSKDGKELLFFRMNRKQNVQEYCAANPKTGKCRVIVRESNPNGWVQSLPTGWESRWINDSEFLWISDRTGYKNIYRYNLKGELLATVTKNGFDTESIAAVDAATGMLYYTARDGENPYRHQLHRVHLDGTGDKRLTDPSLHHGVTVSKKGWFVDVSQSATSVPTTTICDPTGKVVATLAKGNDKPVKNKWVQMERFTYLAADGKTTCYGQFYKPSDFDETKKYPLLVSVYAGPESGTRNESYPMAGFRGWMEASLAELGFVVASFDGRGTIGRGREFLQSVYGKLGIVEIDDQAAGVKALTQRPYIDPKRVGIFGTSYGGYASVMSLLRYPKIFQAASASSSVTKWENYDSIYTERFMWIPQENAEGYAKASAMNYAKDLEGKLLLYYGTADNNVHPSNTLQLIKSLQNNNKEYELQVGTDLEHTMVNLETMLAFFIRTLKP